MEKNRNLFNIILIAMVMALLSTSLMAVPVSAEERVVRVGFFALPGFNEYDAVGRPTGYNVEYLNNIAEHTGWKYEFVKANSWPEALQMLQERKIDLLAPGRKTPEREAEFAFSRYPFGVEYGAILTLDTNYDLNFEDFEQFSKINFGCVKTLVMKDDFFQYAQDNGFQPNVTYYKDTNALISALKIGEVDAIVANLMNAKTNMKVLAKFSPGDFYYMTNKENEELLKELDNMMNHTKTVHSNLEAELVKKYYNFYNSIAFTKEELEYIQAAPNFRVGYLPDSQPISYLDEKTGEASGITRDILDKVSEVSGLKFEYVPLPQGDIDYQFLVDNKIQLVSGIENNSVNATIDELHISNPYLNTQKIMVGKDTKLFPGGDIKIAIMAGSRTLEKTIQAQYPKAEIVKYDTIHDCFEAVLSDKTDVLIQNKYAVERYLLKPKYEKLQVIRTEFLEDELALATIIGADKEKAEYQVLSDPRLISILNKGISGIDDMTISEIVIDHTVNSPYKFTVLDFYYRYRIFIFLLMASIATVVYITYRNFRLKARNMEILRLNEMKLKNITNNINGGVIVLLPNKGFEIIFANDGFLSLMQYSREELMSNQSSKYVTYVPEEDLKILNELVHSKGDGEQISVKLRLLRKDQTYIPALFNGTLATSGTGQKELYCVIMDVSEQLKIMEKLEQEQARYKFLIEKSKEMIFDINIETREVSVSQNFIQVLGWTLPDYLEALTVEAFYKPWHIYDEDKENFSNALRKLLEEERDVECKIRLRKNDRNYQWYSVTHNFMKTNGKSVRIIGRLTDVDEEMKEKEKLFRQTQTDALTGLYNKEAFHNLGEKYFKEENGENSAVIFIDLDNFKTVNDVLGHMTGDFVIKDAAKKLQIIFSQYDLIARFGGDEFCMLIKEIPIKTLRDKLDWTLEKMKAVYGQDEQQVTVSVSIGAAIFGSGGRDLSTLLLCADKALYEAKGNGRNQYVIYRDISPEEIV